MSDCTHCEELPRVEAQREELLEFLRQWADLHPGERLAEEARRLIARIERER